MPALDLAEPDGLTAVRILRQRVINGHVGRVSVVVKDAPFNSAGNPGAEHPDQSRLDDVLVVKDLVVVGFIKSRKQPAAYLGQN